MHLMIEFRRSFDKPEELPKFDFEQGDDRECGERKPTHRETRTHDTTIHTTVRSAVVHETIRPIETEIINNELTVHRHVHHYVHRIRPVLVSSFEEERLAHDILGEGQAALGNAMYRDTTLDSKGSQSNDMCQLCGAEGNLLSHIGSLKRLNNEASSTAACPVCGSDKGIQSDLNRERVESSSERQDGLGREMVSETGERRLADEGRGVGTSRGELGLPEGQHTRRTADQSAVGSEGLARGMKDLNISK